ncbi:MAG: PAS domain S-box protein, partial [Bacteroidales bacterium]|nr:PAS domain S-box protein [Bacteroidales bacterium]
MKFSKTFLKNYLLPFGIVIILFAAIILLTVFPGNLPGAWKFYALISALILSALLLVLILRQTYVDEAVRQATSNRMEEADEKFRSLLETSADGTMMVLEREIVFANFVFLAMSGYTLKELYKMKFEDLIQGKNESGLTLDSLYDEHCDIGRTLNIEAHISCKRGEMRDVVLSLSRIQVIDKDGILVISRDMSGREKIEQESMHLRNELHSS